MNITLVASLNPRSWCEQGKKLDEPPIPLGILSLAAALEEAGHAVTVLDFTPGLANGELPADGSLYPLIARSIHDKHPDVIGFSSMCSSFHLALRMAEAAKREMPEIPVIFGGPQASVADRDILESFPFVDMVLRGEAEQTLPQLIDEISSGSEACNTEGLTWRAATARIRRNPDPKLLPDLDALPMPAFHLLPSGARKTLTLEGGRGCPFSCSFCSTSTYWRRRFRMKSVERLIREIRTLHRTHGAEFFSILHDMFTANSKRVRAFCDALKAEALPVHWGCSARIDCVDEALLEEMSAAGCTAVFYGIETGSARMQAEIGKKLPIEKVESTIEASLRLGIEPTVSFMTGFPTESREDLEQTLRLVEKLIGRPKVVTQMHLLGPERGTQDHRRYHHLLHFDGYYSDISGTSSMLLEPAWFERYPEMFASFYYYESPALSRELLCGIDLFVNVACSVLPQTISGLTKEGRSLLDLYLAWREWTAQRNVGRGPRGRQTVEEYLIDPPQRSGALEWAGRQPASRRKSSGLGKMLSPATARCCRKRSGRSWLSFSIRPLSQPEATASGGATLKGSAGPASRVYCCAART